jgi:hypothetical protein
MVKKKMYNYLYKSNTDGKSKYYLLEYMGHGNDYSLYEVSIRDLKRYRFSDFKMLKRISDKACYALTESPYTLYIDMISLGGECYAN